jgi:hypothetical protein
MDIIKHANEIKNKPPTHIAKENYTLENVCENMLTHVHKVVLSMRDP